MTITDANLAIEPLDIEQQTGVEEEDSGDGEEEHEADDGEHVDPLLSPVILNTINPIGVTEINGDITKYVGLKSLENICHMKRIFTTIFELIDWNIGNQ